MNPLISCMSFFKEQKLETPFIPEKEKPQITCIQEGVYGSKTPTQSLYDLTAFVQEVVTKPCKDYILLGLAGHGVKSRAIHYYVVKGPIAVFIQLKYGNEQETRERIDGILYGVERMLKSVVEDKKLPEGKRLLVIQSDFNASGWGWVIGQPKEIDRSTWHTEGSILQGAIEEIRKI